MFEEVEYEEHTLQCRLGDVLVFFTDGITEAIDSYGNEFGRPRLERLVRDHHHGTAEHILKSLFGAVEAHAHGAEAFDDQSVIVIKT
jgi:sigma-B regulation protein RsbU (phosphoserine phosphatase)